MLTFVGLWVVLVSAGYAAGAAALALLDKRRVIARTADRFFVALWSGLAALSIALLALSPALRLSPALGFGAAFVLVAASVSRRDARAEVASLARSLTPRLLAASLAYAAGAAAYMTRPVVWYDTGLYHYGAVRWLSEFGAVKGLALIHPRFGLASSWFALAAPFDDGPLEARTAALLGGLALLVCGAHALVCASRWLAGRARTSDRFLVFASALALPISLHSGAAASPSPDVPVTILTLVVAWLIVVICESQATHEGRACSALDPRLLPFVLSVFAATIKLSALPLVCVSALFYLSGERLRPGRVLLLCAVGVILFSPFMIYQTVASGCPLLPTGLMCLDLPWSPDPQELRSFTDTIVGWGRWGDTPPPDANAYNWLWRGWHLTSITVRSHLFAIFAALLLAGLALTRFEKVRLIRRWLLLAASAGWAFILMFRANKLLIVCVVVLSAFARPFKARGWLLALGLGGMGLVMYSAPALRFGLGYAAVLWGGFAASRFGRDEPSRRYTQSAALAALLIVAGLTAAVCRAALRVETHRRTPVERAEENFSLIAPPRMPGAVVTRLRVNDVELYKPAEGNQCWAAPLPCTSGGVPEDFFRMPEDIFMRDPARGVAAGFERRTLSERAR